MATLCFNAFNRSAWFEVDPDLPAQIDAAAAAGFTLFGPDAFSLAAHRGRGGSIEDVAARLAGNGMRCFEIAALMVGTDEAEALAQADDIARLAEVLRPDWILTNVMEPLDDRVAANLRTCAQRIGEAGAGLAIEYLPWTPVAGAAAALEASRRSDPERVKVLPDTWHHFRGPDTWADLDALPLDAIAYVQFDDALPVAGDDLLEETLHRRTFPGEGEFDLEEYCAHLRAKGFDGVVSIEILNREWRDRDPAEFTRRAYESTARFWS